MADKENCKKFYRCVASDNGGYTKHDFECPEGTAWSQELETCDHADPGTGCAKKGMNIITLTRVKQAKYFFRFHSSYFKALMIQMEEIQVQQRNLQQQQV